MAYPYDGVQAMIEKDDVDLNMLIQKYFQDDKASFRIYIQSFNINKMYTYTQMYTHIFPPEKNTSNLAEAAIDLRETILSCGECGRGF